MSETIFDPTDYGLSPRFRHWAGDQAEDHNGPFFFSVDADTVETAFIARPFHCNSHRTVHGGVLMMFADYTLCVAANGGTHDSVVTVSCNSEFIGPVVEGDRVDGFGEVIRRGGSLIFVRVTLRVGDRPVLTSSGVIKRIRQQAGP